MTEDGENGECTFMVWPTLALRTAKKQQNRTVGLLQLCKLKENVFFSFLSSKLKIFYDLMYKLNGISDDDFLRLPNMHIVILL